MQVHFNATIGPANHRFRMLDYHVVSTEFCCDAMAGEWRQSVEVSVDGFPHVENLSLVVVTSIFAGDGDVNRTVMPIRFCPWCGERATFASALAESAEAAEW